MKQSSVKWTSGGPRHCFWTPDCPLKLSCYLGLGPPKGIHIVICIFFNIAVVWGFTQRATKLNKLIFVRVFENYAWGIIVLSEGRKTYLSHCKMYPSLQMDCYLSQWGGMNTSQMFTTCSYTSSWKCKDMPHYLFIIIGMFEEIKRQCMRDPDQFRYIS